MKVVVQRVTGARVVIDGKTTSAIDRGYVVFLGVRKGDDESDAVFLAEKCSGLRVFEDGNGRMNLGLEDVGGSVLVVSQFTLYGNVRKGNRPNFGDAATPEEAGRLYDVFIQRLSSRLGGERVKTGVFRAMMEVHLVNDGPVTILIESS